MMRTLGVLANRYCADEETYRVQHQLQSYRSLWLNRQWLPDALTFDVLTEQSTDYNPQIPLESAIIRLLHDEHHHLAVLYNGKHGGIDRTSGSRCE